MSDDDKRCRPPLVMREYRGLSICTPYHVSGEWKNHSWLSKSRAPHSRTP
jgi:hypothetical protein